MISASRHHSRPPSEILMLRWAKVHPISLLRGHRNDGLVIHELIFIGTSGLTIETLI
jgi:hypothetical protein